METFTAYLARHRGMAVIPAGAPPVVDTVATLVKDEYLKRHEAPVFYEKLGEDVIGPVYRLGTAIVLVDLAPALAQLVELGVIAQMNYPNAYSCNPSLRKPV